MPPDFEAMVIDAHEKAELAYKGMQHVDKRLEDVISMQRRHEAQDRHIAVVIIMLLLGLVGGMAALLYEDLHTDVDNGNNHTHEVRNG